MNERTESELDHAREQGQAQYESIRELVAKLHDDESESSREAIHEDALSVSVRSNWYTPGSDPGAPLEFEILLCCGGPSVRLTGTLNLHCEPDTVTLQVQDWFQPWTDFNPATGDESEDAQSILLAYASCFYFGN
jgi:hypothetical protein